MMSTRPSRKRLQGAAALRLGAVTVNGLGLVAVTPQALGQGLGAELGAREDDDALVALLLQDVVQQVGLLHLRHGRHELLDRLGGRALVGDLDVLRVVDLAADGLHDALVQRGGEQQGLTLLGQDVDDALHVRPEAHVEHAVGLVQDEGLDGVELKRALLIEVDEAARGGDEHVDTATQAVDLRTITQAAHHGEHPVAGLLANGACDRVDLLGELAGRGDDEAKGPLALLEVSELVEHGKGEGGSLAGAGLCGGQHVVASQNQRDCLLLDRGGGGVPHLMDSSKGLLGQAEVFESSHSLQVLQIDVCTTAFPDALPRVCNVQQQRCRFARGRGSPGDA